MYLAGRPFKYEFLIDAEEYIVVSRKHYNAQGKMIFALVFDSWESLSPKADLFKTPSGLKGKFIDQASFASRVLAKMIERQKTGWGEYLSKRSAPVIHWVLRNSFWLMMPVALLAITAIVVIRRLSNRRK